MNYKIFLSILISFTSLFAQNNAWTDYVNNFQKAIAASNKNDFSAALAAYEELLKVSPHDADTHYRIARQLNLAGKQTEALQSLKTALELGYDFGNELDSSLVSLKQLKEFSTLESLIHKMKTPVNTSEKAFTITERDLIPEGLAYDPVDNCFYMGGLYKCKILKILNDGTFSYFTGEKQDGLRKMTGMKVDAKRRVLWAASIANSPRPDIDESELGWSGIFKYDLNTGKLIKKYPLHEEGKRHLFNDIDIASNGDIYFTDSDNNTLYRILHDKDEIELFIDNEKFLYPNGIAFGKDDNTLYVASSGDGVYKIDITSSQYRLLETPGNVSLCGIDGMYFYNNSLVCVQNGMNRISRFYLNETGDKVEKLERLETRNPNFEIPTTGAIANNIFYYIANSQMNKVGNNGIITSPDKLNDVIILKTLLND